MTDIDSRPKLALEPDFALGQLHISPSACRVTTGGTEQRVEAQTMMALVVLARAEGATVSRESLIASCWQARIISDDAVTRTIAKVRGLARGMTPPPFVLETIPKIGYRLTVADSGANTGAEAPAETAVPPPARNRWRARRPAMAVAAVVIAAPLTWALLPRPAAQDPAAATSSAAANLPTAAQVSEALIMLDRDRVRDYLDRGWDSNWKLDAEGSNALQTLFMACERNPSHDRGMVALIAQMLVKAGVDVVARNKWDDSALDIAMSPRYCGPHHPVVEFLKSMVPPQEFKRAMTRACGEAYGGKPSQANWSNSTLTREECAAVMADGPTGK